MPLLSSYSTPISLWQGPQDDSTPAPAGPGGSVVTQNKPMPQESDPGSGGATPPPASQDPGVAGVGGAPQAGGLGGQGAFEGGTGYISMADYINGNQDQINAERGALDASSTKKLADATAAYNASADKAAGETAGAVRGEMNDAYGFDTADAYRKLQDDYATRQAHPDVAGYEASADPSQTWTGQYRGAKDSNGNPLPGNVDGTNPYDLANFKGADFADVEKRVGNTAAGQQALTDFQKLGNTGAELKNLENWGGVFDALGHQNPNAGSAAAGFDATLLGRGMAGTAAKGAAASQAGKDYMDAAIKANMGKNDQADYKGVDRYTAKPADNKPSTEQTPTGMTDDSGIDRGTGQYPSGPVATDGNTYTSTDDSGGNRSPNDPGNPYQTQPGDPNDPTQWGWGGGG